MIEARDLLSPAPAAFCFRSVLDAVSKPGTEVVLRDLAGVPAPLHAASATLVLSLCDFQTPVWVSPKLDSVEVRAFLRFHAGVPFVDQPGEAHFALMDAVEFKQFHRQLNIGTGEYPDRAATAIIQTTAFAAGDKVTLEGPGIRNKMHLSVAGIEVADWQRLATDRTLFPLGIDSMFVAQTAIVAVPRSTHITLTEGQQCM